VPRCVKMMVRNGRGEHRHDLTGDLRSLMIRYSMEKVEGNPPDWISLECET